MFEGKAAARPIFRRTSHGLQNSLQKLLPHPESDLGLLASVRLNLFSTEPHRRFSRAMNDRNTRHKMPKNTAANTKTDRTKNSEKTRYCVN
jgi:hypothetical protein